MEVHGVTVQVKNRPEIDRDFIPLARYGAAYRAEATHPFAIAVEREDGLVSVYKTALRTGGTLGEADRLYVDRLAKLMLWLRGGWKITVCGSDAAGEYLRDAYGKGGSRDFDRGFMELVYEKTFTVACVPYGQCPAPREAAAPVGRHLRGCRIGLDAGASNLKVSAVIDGESVFSQSIPWRPKETGDPSYHLAQLAHALKLAQAHLPRVDGVGVSSAGVFVANRCMVASLFLGVTREDFDRQIKDIYRTAVATLGENIPFSVANDGDVTALAGAMALHRDGVLGISMGTSQAGGYVDGRGNVTGWFNEVAFAPIDVQEHAALDEWAGDVGCGVKYLSQDGAVKLAKMAGIPMPDGGPADQFASLRVRMDGGDPQIAPVFRDLGIYLGHALAVYAQFYEIQYALIMGGVAGGRGGELLLAEARRVLAEEYPRCTFPVEAPDDKVCMLGQSVAAASLPGEGQLITNN